MNDGLQLFLPGTEPAKIETTEQVQMRSLRAALLKLLNWADIVKNELEYETQSEEETTREMISHGWMVMEGVYESR